MMLMCFNCGQRCFQIDITDKGNANITCVYCKHVKDYRVDVGIPKWMLDDTEQKRKRFLERVEKPCSCR